MGGAAGGGGAAHRRDGSRAWLGDTVVFPGRPVGFEGAAASDYLRSGTVLLGDRGPEQRVLGAEDPRSVTLSISHYGREPIRKGRLLWAVEAGGETLGRGTIEPVEAAPGMQPPASAIPPPRSRAADDRDRRPPVAPMIPARHPGMPRFD